jgi:methylenetetrahydrofolate dehydrogenase (NADP+) / methenyltetrahydrofolate cyclohydrolase
MAEARLIDGREPAAALRAAVAAHAATLAAQGVVPGLAVVLVGDDPASQVYVRNKGKATIEAGLRSIEHRLDASTSEADLLALIARLNGDPEIDGILVQLPVPKQIDPQRIIAAIDPAKDVDGLNPVSVGTLWSGGAGLVPCTPYGCLILLRRTLGRMAGAHAVVIGRSNLVGKPMAALLLAENCTVTIAHSQSRDLPALARGADILVVAVGRPGMVRGQWIKPGATVIDVGMNRLPLADGKSRLVGDVAFAEARAVAGAITPVPGGVGQMTVACLLRNTLVAACRRRGLPVPSL